MLRPTLLIGLGTSGLTIVSEVQKLVYETFGVNRLPIFRYVYLETDTSKSHEKTPAGSDIMPLHITVQSLQQAYRVLSNNPQLSMDWISKDLPSQLTYNAQGAGGVRPAGRLLLWGDGNFGRVYDAISDAWRDIRNPDAGNVLERDFTAITNRAGFDDRAVVYVVGTLVGGTCSGTFIDLGYVLRSITGMQEAGPLYGMFLVPASNLTISAGYGNTYGAIQELEFFRKPGNFYEEVWPNNVRMGANALPPYAIVYLISSEYGQAGCGAMNLDGCLKMAALRLFCDLVGLSSLRGAVLADGMNEGFGFYATFGISAVMYPKYVLMEAGGCAQGQELCDRWLMSDAYLNATGERVVINRKAVFEEADSFVASQLKHAFGTLGSKGAGSGLRLDIADDIDQIMRKEEPRPPRFLESRFNSGKPGNYYSAVNDNLSAAQDQMVGAIRDFFYEKIRETENFEYLELLLTEISRSFEETLKYWDQARIPTAANEWNDHVTRCVQRLLEGPGTTVGQKRQVLEDRAENLLGQLMMFLMRRVLATLREGLQRGSVTTVDQSVALPTIERLREERKQMQEAREGLRLRGEAIANEVKDVSVPVCRVWSSGSFESDLKLLRQAYSARYGVPSLADMAQEPLWEFLSKVDGGELFVKIKVGYQGRFREFLPAVNVTEEATKHLDVTRQYADRALAGMMRLELPAESGRHGIPRFVLGADSAALDGLVQRLRAQGLHDFQPGQGGHVRSLPLLDHAVVFYEEKSRIDPLNQLAVRSTLEWHYRNPGTDAMGNRIADPAIWLQQRLAYDIRRRARVAQFRALVDFVLDFAVIWGEAHGEWRPAGVRWSGFPVDVQMPPRFQYKDAGGLTREFRLDTDPRLIRDLAENQAQLDALSRAVTQQVRDLGEERLSRTFDEEIKAYLTARWPEQLGRKTEAYFGSPGKRNGLIHSLLGNGAQKGDATARLL
jgi:hypothetical protein